MSSRRPGQPPGVDWEDAYHNLDSRLRQLQQNYNAKEEAIKQLKVALRKVGDHHVMEAMEAALQNASSSFSPPATTRSPRGVAVATTATAARNQGETGRGGVTHRNTSKGPAPLRSRARAGVRVPGATSGAGASRPLGVGMSSRRPEANADGNASWGGTPPSAMHRFEHHLVEPATTTSTTITEDTSSFTAEGAGCENDRGMSDMEETEQPPPPPPQQAYGVSYHTQLSGRQDDNNDNHHDKANRSSATPTATSAAAERAAGGLLPDPAMIWGAAEAHQRLERMAQALYHANEELRRELNESSSKVQGLEHELAAARAAFVGKESNVSALRDELYRVVRERDAAVVAQRSAQAEVSGLEGTIAERTAELSSLRTRLVAGADHNELLRQELRQLADAVQEKTADAASLRSQLAVAQSALSSQRHTNEQLLTELKHQHEQLVAERKKVIQLAREVQVHSLAQQRVTDLEQQVRRLQEDRVRADGEHLQLMRAFSTVSEEVMTQAKEALGSELEAARSAAAHWEEAAKRLYKDIASRVEEHQQCRQALESAQQTKTELTSQLRTAREELSLCLAKLSVAWPQHHRVTSHLPTAELETLMRATAAQQALKDEVNATKSPQHHPSAALLEEDEDGTVAMGPATKKGSPLAALESALAALSSSPTTTTGTAAAGAGAASASAATGTATKPEEKSRNVVPCSGSVVGGPSGHGGSPEGKVSRTTATAADGFLASALDTFLHDLPADPTSTAEKLWELSEANAGLCADMERLQLSHEVLHAHVEEVERQKRESALAVAAVEAREARGQARLAAEMDRVMFLEKQIHSLRGYAVSPLRETVAGLVDEDSVEPGGSANGVGENVLELFLGQLVSYAPRPTEAATLVGGPSSSPRPAAFFFSDTFFCTADFLLHETIMTPTIVGLSGFLDTTAAYRIRMDALLLYYLATRELVVQLHRVRGEGEVFRAAPPEDSPDKKKGDDEPEGKKTPQGGSAVQPDAQDRDRLPPRRAGSDGSGSGTDSELALMEQMYETVAEGRVRLLDLVLEEKQLEAEHPTLRGHIHLYRLHHHRPEGDEEINPRSGAASFTTNAIADAERGEHVASVEFKVSARLPFCAAFRSLVRETTDAAAAVQWEEEHHPQPEHDDEGEGGRGLYASSLAPFASSLWAGPGKRNASPSRPIPATGGGPSGAAGRDSLSPGRRATTVYEWMRRSSSASPSLGGRDDEGGWNTQPPPPPQQGHLPHEADLLQQKATDSATRMRASRHYGGHTAAHSPHRPRTPHDALRSPGRSSAAAIAQPLIPSPAFHLSGSHLPLLAHQARQIHALFPRADSLTTTTTSSSASSSAQSGAEVAVMLQKRLQEARRWQQQQPMIGPTPLRPKPAPAAPPAVSDADERATSVRGPSRGFSPPPTAPPISSSSSLPATWSRPAVNHVNAVDPRFGVGVGGGVGGGDDGFQFFSIDVFRVELPADLPPPVPRLACFYELRSLQREIRLPAPPTSRYTIVYPQTDGEAGTCFAIRDAAERFALRREPLTLFFLNADEEEDDVVWGMAVCELQTVLDQPGRIHCFDLPILGADNCLVDGALVRVRLQASILPSRLGGTVSGGSYHRDGSYGGDGRFGGVDGFPGLAAAFDPTAADPRRFTPSTAAFSSSLPAAVPTPVPRYSSAPLTPDVSLAADLLHGMNGGGQQAAATGAASWSSGGFVPPPPPPPPSSSYSLGTTAALAGAGELTMGQPPLHHQPPAPHHQQQQRPQLQSQPQSQQEQAPPHTEREGSSEGIGWSDGSNMPPPPPMTSMPAPGTKDGDSQMAPPTTSTAPAPPPPAGDVGTEAPTPTTTSAAASAPTTATTNPTRTTHMEEKLLRLELQRAWGRR